jgi:hypothetical protein
MGRMIKNGVIERLVSVGLSRKQAEVAWLIAHGTTMPDLKQSFGSQGIQYERCLRSSLGPRSRIKVFVDSCRHLMMLEMTGELQEEIEKS